MVQLSAMEPLKLVMHFVQLNHFSQFDHLNFSKWLTKILQSVQFDCLGWFDRLKYFKRLRWTVQLFSGDLSLTVKPGEPFQVDCPGYDVELIKLVTFFFLFFCWSINLVWPWELLRPIKIDLCGSTVSLLSTGTV